MCGPLLAIWWSHIWDVQIQNWLSIFSSHANRPSDPESCDESNHLQQTFIGIAFLEMTRQIMHECFYYLLNMQLHTLEALSCPRPHGDIISQYVMAFLSGAYSLFAWRYQMLLGPQMIYWQRGTNKNSLEWFHVCLAFQNNELSKWKKYSVDNFFKKARHDLSGHLKKW